MPKPTETDDRSADSTLTFDQLEVDPFYNTDDSKKPSPVWRHSDYIYVIIKNQILDQHARAALLEALIKQLPTLILYRQVLVQAGLLLQAPNTPTIDTREMSIYVLMFPGEAKDNTGIKDLNDKVLGYNQCSRYIQKRQETIVALFSAKFIVAGQNYKAAYFVTYDKKREDFVKCLAELDSKLREILLSDILPAAMEEAKKLKDEEARKKRLAEIEKLRKTLQKNKKYKFDIYFGLAAREFHASIIDTTFLAKRADSSQEGKPFRKGETRPT
jgi:hypothetical protein